MREGEGLIDIINEHLNSLLESFFPKFTAPRCHRNTEENTQFIIETQRKSFEKFFKRKI